MPFPSRGAPPAARQSRFRGHRLISLPSKVPEQFHDV